MFTGIITAIGRLEMRLPTRVTAYCAFLVNGIVGLLILARQ